MSGSLEKLVAVRTNDPRHRDLTLTVTAVVEPEIEMSDFGLFFGNAPEGKEVRREVLLTIPPGRNITLLGAETTDRRVVVRLEPVPAGNSKKWRLIAIRRADAKPGDYYGEIRVKTSSRLNPTLIIYMHGTTASAS